MIEKPIFISDNPCKQDILVDCAYHPKVEVRVDTNAKDVELSVGGSFGQWVSAKGLKDLGVKLYHIGLWLENDK
jgi:hypothetical protein